MISFKSGRFVSGERDPDTRSIGVQVGSGFNMAALEERKIYCLLVESKPDCCVVHPVRYSLHRLSYITYFVMNNRRRTQARDQVRLILGVIY
jgi:hypothetical protein